LWRRALSFGGRKLGEEGSEDADGQEERAEVETKLKAGEIDEFRGMAAPMKPMPKATRRIGRRTARFVGRSSLSVDEMGEKGGGQDQALMTLRTLVQKGLSREGAS